jgi:solute:Na+ symporter, SSS family
MDSTSPGGTALVSPTPAPAAASLPGAPGLALGMCLAFALIGAWHARRVARGQKLDDYLTARGAIGTGLSIATLVATLAGGWILSSPALVAFFYGPAAIVGYCVGQALPMWLFPVVGNRVRTLHPTAATLSDAVGARYGTPVRLLVSGLALFYMSVYLAAELTVIAQALNALAGWALLPAAALVAGATVLYAAWGGVRTAIAVDRLQIGLIVVLLALITAVLWQSLGGDPLAGARKADPSPLAWTAAGWETAACLVLGIVASNLFDNSFWARVFACRDAAVVRRSFTLAGFAIGVILVPASLFGLWVVGNADTSNPAALPAALVLAKAPTWAALGVLALFLVLAMSTISALFNGLVGVLTADARAFGAPGDHRTVQWARATTVLIAIPAVWVASFGRDATYLFFIANLVCAAAVVPVFLGLWAGRLRGGWVLAAALVGMVAGALWFPANIEGSETWLTVPGGQRFITSYLLALGLSTAIAVVGALTGKAVAAVARQPA